MSNYAFWAINIKYVLMNKDVWEVVNSTFVKLSSLFNSEPSSETFFKLLIAFSHLFWSKNNSKTCVTIALRCINSFKRFIKNLNTHIMWLKLKKLYKVQRFNVCYLMFTTLLSHHYNNCKSVKNYVKQIKTSSLHLKEMNSIFSDWIILTVFLNNLESLFNVFTIAKQQTI